MRSHLPKLDGKGVVEEGLPLVRTEFNAPVEVG